jgi:hypothetical protein
VDRVPSKVVGLHNGSRDLSSMDLWIGVERPRQMDSTSMDIFCPRRWWIVSNSVIFIPDMGVLFLVRLIVYVCYLRWREPASALHLFVYMIDSLMSNKMVFTSLELHLAYTRAILIKLTALGG